MKIPKLTEIKEFFSITTFRFPATISIFWILLAVVSYSLHSDNSDTENEMARICFALGLLVPVSLIIQFIGQKWPTGLQFKALGFLILALVYGLSYWFLVPDLGSNIIAPIRYFSVLLAAHLMLAIVPLFFNKSNFEIWHLNTSMFTRWLIGAFYCAIIFSGLAIALLAADNLFSIHVGSDAYLQVYFVVVFIIHPYYFMGLWKDGKLFKPLARHVEEGFQVLMKYIMIPLIIIYFIILYTYGLKILITFELPKGWVSSLILGFAGIAILCYLVNYLFPLNKEEQFLGIFDRWIFPAILPLLPLLFIAILHRINEYGFTIERYVVFALAIWLSLTTLLFLWTKNRKLAFVPVSLLIFIFIGFFSPIDAFHVSVRSQTNRLIGILDSNKLIGPDQLILPVIKKIDSKQAQSLSSIISMLDELNAIPQLPIQLKDNKLCAASLSKALKIENLGANNSIYYGFSLASGEKLHPQANDVYYFRVQEYNTGTVWQILGETCIIEAPSKTGIGQIDLTDFCKSLEALGQDKNMQTIENMSFSTKGKDGIPLVISFLNFSFNKNGTVYRINSGDGIVYK